MILIGPVRSRAGLMFLYGNLRALFLALERGSTVVT